MKTNEEYWKQRCLLAESMLEEKIDSYVPPTVSPFITHSWTYVKFIELLKENSLFHRYECEFITGHSSYYKHIIKVFCKVGLNPEWFTVVDLDKESVYLSAYNKLKEHLNTQNEKD
jgi:hypothetical protein